MLLPFYIVVSLGRHFPSLLLPLRISILFSSWFYLFFLLFPSPSFTFFLLVASSKYDFHPCNISLHLYILALPFRTLSHLTVELKLPSQAAHASNNGSNNGTPICQHDGHCYKQTHKHKQPPSPTYVRKLKSSTQNTALCCMYEINIKPC